MSTSNLMPGAPNPLPYPDGPLRALLRAPLLFYRMGLGDLLDIIHIMVLTTRGRTSGLPRHTPIEYRRHGSKIYLVSAWGARPNWYQNLLHNPLATVQLGQQVRAVRAQPVTDPAEALRAIHLFRRVAPARYDAVLSYVIEATVNARTLPTVSGNFTIVRLDLTTDAPPLPPLPVTLGWLPPAALIACLAALLLVFSRLRGRRGR